MVWTTGANSLGNIVESGRPVTVSQKPMATPSPSCTLLTTCIMPKCRKHCRLRHLNVLGFGCDGTMRPDWRDKGRIAVKSFIADESTLWGRRMWKKERKSMESTQKGRVSCYKRAYRDRTRSCVAMRRGMQAVFMCRASSKVSTSSALIDTRDGRQRNFAEPPSGLTSTSTRPLAHQPTLISNPQLTK